MWDLIVMILSMVNINEFKFVRLMIKTVSEQKNDDSCMLKVKVFNISDKIK